LGCCQRYASVGGHTVVFSVLSLLCVKQVVAI
jgi:hypothetical protein